MSVINKISCLLMTLVLGVLLFVGGFALGTYSGARRVMITASGPVTNTIYSYAQDGKYDALVRQKLATPSVVASLKASVTNAGPIVGFEVVEVFVGPLGLPATVTVLVERETGTYTETVMFNSLFKADVVTVLPKSR